LIPDLAKSVTRHLVQCSERKKDRMLYADPYDHAFNYERKFVDRANLDAFERQSNVLGLQSGPISHKILKRVNEIDVEEEDELVTVLKEIMQHEKELEEAKIKLV
jgi:hypothetical protein